MDTSWGGMLSRLDDKTKTFVNYPPDSRDPHRLNGGGIVAIHEDRSGTMWIGALDGLYRFDRDVGKFTRFTESHGLPSSTIQGILEDDAGQLWLSTRKGLSRFDPKAGTFRNFDIVDGLQGNDFSEACYARGQGGEMFFGGANGFNAFHPDEIRDNPYVPTVVLTDFKIANKPVPIGAESALSRSIPYTHALVLPYSYNVFSFEFAGLSYANSHKNRYRYRLEGLEPDWNEVGSKQRVAIYTNLSPGRYVFRVQASNDDAVWNEAGLSLVVTITPPWWQTWWFRATVTAATLGLAYAGYRWRVHALRQRTRRLEVEVGRRTADLREANRTLEAFSFSVSHDLRAPLRRIDGFAQMLREHAGPTLDDRGGHYLDVISRSAQRMARLIDDLLAFSRFNRRELKTEPIQLSRLVEEVIQECAPEAAGREIQWQISPLPTVVGDPILIRAVLVNLIMNALKFTRSRDLVVIEIGTMSSPEANVIFVRDNGVGFDMAQADRLFGAFERLHPQEEFEGSGIGLANVRQIIARHGGTVRAEGEVDRGATFYINLPATPSVAPPTATSPDAGVLMSDR